MKIEQSLEFLCKLWIESSEAFDDAPNSQKVIKQIDVSKFHSPTFYLEVVLHRNNADSGEARLYRISDGATFGLVSWTAGSIRKRSSPFSLTGIDEYKIQARKTSGIYTQLSAVRVIIVDEAPEITKTESHHDIGTSSNVTGTTWRKVGGIWKYEADKFDGPVTIYMEATIYQDKTTGSPTSKQGYLGLWDITTDTLKLSIYTRENTPTRIRASVVGLVDGHEYTLALKHETAGYTVYMGGGGLIIEQSNLTKTRVMKHLCFGEWTTSTTYLTIRDNHLYTAGNYSGFNVDAFFETTMLDQPSGGGGGFPYLPYTAWHKLIQNSLSKAELSTTSSSYVRLRSGEFSPSDAKDFRTQKKHTGSGGTSIRQAWVLLDLSPPLPVKPIINKFNRKNLLYELM